MQRAGFTLIELTISVAIMGILSVGLVSLLQTSLQIKVEPDRRTELEQRAHRTMDRLTSEIKITSHLLVPNGRRQISSTLAYSLNGNDDGDYYFGDALFPRFDEDTAKDMDGDSSPGIRYIDENGDGWDDVASGVQDDDEDFSKDEDWCDGVDNDGDGSIDEDYDDNNYKSGKPGIAAMDDDGDGRTDEDSQDDDDEDGTKDEDPLNPIMYYRYGGTDALLIDPAPMGSADTLCLDVTSFIAHYHPETATMNPYLTLQLILSSGGETVTVYEAVHMENLQQKCGKRVR